MLPVKSILREYLSTEESDHEEAEEAEEAEEEEEEEEDEKEDEKKPENESSAKTELTGPKNVDPEISETGPSIIDLSGTGPGDSEFTDISSTGIMGASPNAKVDYTFKVDSGFNPDQFDIFSKIPIPNPPVKKFQEELPFADNDIGADLEENAIESEELGDIEFEEL